MWAPIQCTPDRLPSKSNRLSLGVAGDGEHFGQRQLAIAVKDFEPLDLGQRLVARPVGRQPLDFDGHGRFGAVG